MARIELKQLSHAAATTALAAVLVVGAVPTAAMAQSAASANATQASTSASTTPEPAPGDDAEPAGHCWYNAATQESGCFGSAAELDGALAALGADQPAAQSPAAADSTGAAQELSSETRATASSSLVTVGTVYNGSGYSGSSYRVLDYGSCYSGNSAFINLAAVGWNDKVSSFRGSNGCRVRLHEHSDGGGLSYGDYFAASSLGSFDNRASAASFVA